MKKQPWVSFSLAGVSLTDFGLEIPSPFSKLELSNSEIASMTSWTLSCIVGGDYSKKVNVAAFEALLYSAAQNASGYSNSSGVPVAFAFGWLDDNGKIGEYASYQGFTLQFDVSTNDRFLKYTIKGFASAAIQTNVPALNIPAISGFVQPSAILEALCKATKITSYYDLDIDHNDVPTYISHGAFTTSFTNYVRGKYSTEDDYDSFPGLVKLATSYNATREAAGLSPDVASLRQVVDNVSKENIFNYLVSSNCDTKPQCASFSYWVDEPTTTHPGVVHFKSNAGRLFATNRATLEYGTANTNILSLGGSYNGVAYSMSNMSFKSLGFAVDGSGTSIIDSASVTNSWSATVSDVYQTANIINDINAIASQFSGDFQVTIPGAVAHYSIAQPVSLIVMSGNTLSPVSGIYNVVSVNHEISTTFITTLKIQRFMMGSANQTAASQGIFISRYSGNSSANLTTTANVISPYKVDLGTMYPTMEDIHSW